MVITSQTVITRYPDIVKPVIPQPPMNVGGVKVKKKRKRKKK